MRKASRSATPASSSYLATFAPAAGFGTLMAAEAYRRGAERARQLTILGDGAAWIWNLAAQHFPAATQIVDLYHAREHLHELGEPDHPSSCSAPATTAGSLQRLADLDHGDIPAILAAARALPLTSRKARDRDKALHYFETNAHRMHYAWYRDHGLFIGSGAVEAGCKSRRRPAAQTVGHALDRTRSHRNPHPALPGSQQPLGARSGRSPATRPRQPDPASEIGTHTQTTPVSGGYPPVTYIHVPHPERKGVRHECRGR